LALVLAGERRREEVAFDALPGRDIGVGDGAFAGDLDAMVDRPCGWVESRGETLPQVALRRTFDAGPWRAARAPAIVILYSGDGP